MFEIRASHYEDILKLEPTFISLDISVSSTGWIRSINGVVEKGTKTLNAAEGLPRRKEFKAFVKELFGSEYYPYVFIEDVIMGTNFKTTRALIELNCIVDDLADEGFLKIGKIKREDNNSWKKYLKQVSNYEPIIKNEDPKVSIRNSMNILGFTDNVAQDIYDALGMAVSTIYRDSILKKEKVVTGKLKDDLKVGFEIKQFKSLDLMEKPCNKWVEKYQNSREVEYLDWSNEKRDILSLFKRKVKDDNRDDRIYKIKVASTKLGILALKRDLDTSEVNTYLLITKKK